MNRTHRLRLVTVAPWTLSVQADLYAQGWTLPQIGAELGVHWSTVSQQLQKASVTMLRGAPPAHPASTDQIVELRDQGLAGVKWRNRSI
jgi:hypothetical protein